MGLIPEWFVVLLLLGMGAGGVHLLHQGSLVTEELVFGIALCAVSVIGLVFMYMTKGTHGDF
jgi:hypothetical protein